VWNLLHDIEVPNDKTSPWPGKVYGEEVQKEALTHNIDSAAL
jgi:hypothetical protein